MEGIRCGTSGELLFSLTFCSISPLLPHMTIFLAVHLKDVVAVGDGVVALIGLRLLDLLFFFCLLFLKVSFGSHSKDALRISVFGFFSE